MRILQWLKTQVFGVALTVLAAGIAQQFGS
jgi:hypothetical protein